MEVETKMSTSIRGRFLAAGLCLAVAAPLLACGDVTVPEALTLKAFHGLHVSTDGCVHQELATTRGGFDVRISSLGGGDFVVYMHLQNNLLSNEESTVGIRDTKGVRVQSFEVTFDREGVWSFLPESLSVRTEAMIATDESMFVPVGIIPRSVAKLIHSHNDIFSEGPLDLFLTVKAKGQLYDGTEAVSNELGFLVTTCSNCLVPCPGGEVEAVCGDLGAQPDAYSCGEASSESSEPAGPSDG